MSTLLHIDSSARFNGSITRQLSAAYVEQWQAKNHGGNVVQRDLAKDTLPHITEALIGAYYTPADKRSAEQESIIALSDKLVDELLAADTLVIGIPMYNFSVPGVFKSYIDQVVRAGVTWNPANYTGLLLNKKAIVVTARGGGGYGAGEAREAYNSQDPLLRSAFGLMGVTDMEFIHINNTIRGEDVVNGALAEAREKIASLVPTLTK